MSNCINIIRGNRVTFSPDEIDSIELLSLIQQSEKAINQDNCVDDSVDPDLKITWWYLSRNTVFSPNGSVEIRFGEGRSLHTWRDFKATIATLKKVMKKSFPRMFHVTDEFDSFNQAREIRVLFGE